MARCWHRTLAFWTPNANSTKCRSNTSPHSRAFGPMESPCKAICLRTDSKPPHAPAKSTARSAKPTCPCQNAPCRRANGCATLDLRAGPTTYQMRQVQDTKAFEQAHCYRIECETLVPQ